MFKGNMDIILQKNLVMKMVSIMIVMKENREVKYFDLSIASVKNSLKDNYKLVIR